MSDMKCPFCGKHIRYLGTDLFTCDACHIMLPAKHWIAYINTRKALDVAVDAIKWIHETYNLGMGYEAAIMEKCEFALEQIIALEQKDK